MKTTKVFSKNIKLYNDKYRAIVNKGSTRSSKTWSILQLLYLIATKSNKPLLISIVSESIPHLKRGCIRDFETMLSEDGLWNVANWNATDKIYKVGKCKIEFFSADNSGKVHGASRDILFINECQNIPYEIYRQLAVRTRNTIFLDYNPVEYFWVDENVLIRDEAILIHSTYKDNDFLTKEQIDEIESNMHDASWWQTYGLGETGSREGLCIKNWEQVDSMPTNYKRRWIGLDFGFTNDPTAILDVRLSDGKLWIDELTYRPNLTNPDIAKEFKAKSIGSSIEIVADSAEPKSIQEIKAYGYHVEGALKGSDSIKNGIDILNRYPINVTKTSLNVIKELRSYKYKQDNDGKYLNTPIDKYNHAMDALRYVALNKLQVRRSPSMPTGRTFRLT